MKTITFFTTNLTSEQAFQKMNALMTNNKYALVDNEKTWIKFNCCFSLQMENNTITIYSWIKNGMYGEMNIEKGISAFPYKRKMRAFLQVIIEILKADEAPVQGYVPVVKGKHKINRNVDTLERGVKIIKQRKTDIYAAFTALALAIINWIIIIAGDYIFFYLPCLSIFISITAIIATVKESKQSGKVSILVVFISILSIALALLSFFLFFLSLLGE